MVLGIDRGGAVGVECLWVSRGRVRGGVFVFVYSFKSVGVWLMSSSSNSEAKP